MLSWSVLSLVIAILSLLSVIAAYIDPNTGGMLFQILAVLFGVISGALLLFSGRIKGMYYRVRRKIQEPQINSTDDNKYQDSSES